MASRITSAVQQMLYRANDQVIKARLATLSGALADEVANRVVLETFFRGCVEKETPRQWFAEVSDSFWFWLHTEGYRRSPSVRALLPAMPDDDIQLQFTGSKGDAVLLEAFAAYALFRDTYTLHVGPVDHCTAILDFGCGWGRIIRFFLKDAEPSVLWGVDPVEQMIEISRRDNRWCNFERIEPEPPTPFPDETFDMIYSFSVFSHMSEDMHRRSLAELERIVKPGGLVMVTTRGRDFIQKCADMRRSRSLASYHPGPRSSASAFPDTDTAIAEYDRGDYCFSSLAEKWSYWGEAAISKDYVLRRWTDRWSLVDYIDDRRSCDQNVIVMRKPR